MSRMTVDQCLGVNKFNLDHDNPHIQIDKKECLLCNSRPCQYACPAGLYKPYKEQGMSFDFAGCLECGTCRIICIRSGAIQWDYPRGSLGVDYRYG